MTSPSPTPRPKWSARMGSVMRRTSSVLTISRPSTPSIHSVERDSSDSSSIKQQPQRVDTSSTLLAEHNPHAPSPIAESPAREAAASQEAVGPSPLAADAITSSPTLTASPEPILANPESTIAETLTSPVGYTPPPLLDSTVGNPGAFTDEPEELPQTQTVVDPYAPTPPQSVKEKGTMSDVEDVKDGRENAGLSYAHDTLAGEEQLPEPSASEPTATSEPTAASESAAAPSAEPVIAPSFPEPSMVPAPEPEPPVLETTPSYFDAPVVESAKSVRSPEQPSTDFVVAVQENELPPPEPIPQEVHQEQEPREFSTHVEPPAQDGMDYVDNPTVFYPGMPVPAPASVLAEPADPARASTLKSLPPYAAYEGYDIWGGAVHEPIQGKPREETPAEVMVMPVEGNGGASRAESVRMPLEDPFADPIAPRIPPAQDNFSQMPHPEVSHQQEQPPMETHEDAHGAITMPLPAIHEAIPSRSIHHVPSHQSFTASRGQVETDETRPLLSAPGTPAGKNASYLQPSTANHISVSPNSPLPSSSAWRTSGLVPRLHDLGWLEYHLPDGTFYYVHPTRRVTTDVNLRSEKALNAVTRYVERQHVHRETPAGVELWLRDAGTAKKGFLPGRSWVDHHARTVMLERDASGKGKVKSPEEDQLDMEYRYWSYLEGHPAHTVLPVKTKSEAMDVLTWAWTDRLLPSQHSVPAPFTQEECQELMSLLRSFNGDDQGDLGIQTRIVSRILLRVAHWRQHHFRPNKPLPKDVNSSHSRLPVQRRPYRRAVFDFLISCLCLGIPYIFLERSQHHRMDEEGGLRGAGPMFVIGACTCLVAAIVLSASVTFLSLPGLDSVARIAGFVAILVASFSMASTLVAIFRYKGDMDIRPSHIGGEGLLSRRTMVMSLPLVFLAYAIIAFITGIVLYSFRGVAFGDPDKAQTHFDDYTRWTVVGLLGALAGMLTMSLLLLRR